MAEGGLADNQEWFVYSCDICKTKDIHAQALWYCFITRKYYCSVCKTDPYIERYKSFKSDERSGRSNDLRIAGIQTFLTYCCDICHTGNAHPEATLYCIDCDILFCNSCIERHKEDFKDTHRLLGKDKTYQWGIRDNHPFLEYLCDECKTVDIHAEATWCCTTCNEQLCKVCKDRHNENLDTHRLLGEDEREKWRIYQRKRDEKACFRHLCDTCKTENVHAEALWYCVRSDKQLCKLCTEKRSNNFNNTRRLAREDEQNKWRIHQHDGDSQDCFKYVCDICKTVDRHAKATWYCITSDNQLCEVCIEQHNKRFNDKHQLLGKDATDKWGKFPYIDLDESHTELNVHTETDVHRCDIQGMCQLEDGRIVLSDYKNKNLKLLDTDYTLISLCVMPGKPSRICYTERGEIAAALEDRKAVQFVTVTNEGMVLSHYKHLGYKCKGLAYKGHRLYITPVGLGNRICVYDLRKETNLDIVQFVTEHGIPINVPTAVTVCSNGARIAIVGVDNNIVIIDDEATFQRKVVKVEDRLLRDTGPKDVCMDDRGNMFVSAKIGSVFHFNENHEPANMKCFTSGMHMPETLLVDTKQCKLLLQQNTFFGGSDVIHVYDIKYTVRENSE